MVTFPNCKINLGLNILRRRYDGLHDIETVFYPLPLTDVLEAVEGKGPVQFVNTGIQGGSAADNLCVRAWRLLKQDHPELPDIKMHLHKTIPVGAGLGGGSADAAFTLTLLNQKFKLGLQKEQMAAYASQLGSDCPFFLINTPCLAGGFGEQLQTIDLSLSGYSIFLVNPNIHIRTADLFAKIAPAIPERNIREIIRKPIAAWKEELKNDFEPVAFVMYPEIKEIKESLYRQNAVYAAMTGTGSTVYGIFRVQAALEMNSKYFCRWLSCS